MSLTDRLLEQFKAAAGQRGTIISLAFSTDEAQEHVLSLIRQKSIKIVISSASALGDIINLRGCLVSHGVRVTEAHLVGLVVQLLRGKDVPLQQVAELISAAAGREVAAEPAELVAAARGLLKEIYHNADLGITEADFGIAQTGEVVMLENTANARLAAVLPRLHLTLLDSRCIVTTKSDIAGRVKHNGSGIPGHKVPALITHLAGRPAGADAPGAGHVPSHTPVEEHILIIRR